MITSLRERHSLHIWTAKRKWGNAPVPISKENTLQISPTHEQDTMPDDNEDQPGPIAMRIKELIESKGVQPDQVRKKIIEITGVSKQALTGWFTGNITSPRVEYIIAVADYYDADLIWILTGKEAAKASYSTRGAAPVTIERIENINVTI